MVICTISRLGALALKMGTQVCPGRKREVSMRAGVGVCTWNTKVSLEFFLLSFFPHFKFLSR